MYDRTKDMIARTMDGQTLQQIGDHWGVTRERVRQILNKAGLSQRGCAIRTAPAKAAKLAQQAAADVAAKLRQEANRKFAAELAAEYARGESAYTLAAKYGIGPGRVSYLLRRHGHPMRPQWEVTGEWARRISEGRARSRKNREDATT